MSDEASTAAPDPEPPGPARFRGSRRKLLITGSVAGILAAAAIGAVAAVPGPAAPVPTVQRLEYTRLPAPCSVLAGATVATYLPDTTSSPDTEPSSRIARIGGCSWSGNTLRMRRTLDVVIAVYDTSDGLSQAQHYYRTEMPHSCRNCNGHTVTTQPVPGLGDQATAVVAVATTGNPAAGQDWTAPQVFVGIRSGNGIVELLLTMNPGAEPPAKPTSAALLAETIAMARDALAALAGHPHVQPAPPPRYARPHDACSLVGAATLARYAPGATVDREQGPANVAPGAPQPDSCFWGTPIADLPAEDFLLGVDVTVYRSSEDAQGGYLFDVRLTRTGGMGTTRSVQQVKGLGEQAIAIFQVGVDNSNIVTLCVWSGNAELQTSFNDLTPSIEPQLPRATILAADIAMARDALARLPA